MRELLLNWGTEIVWILMVLEVAVFVLLIRQHLKKGKNILPLLMALVGFGLIYDALIMALGSFIGEGGLLAGLSRFRFVFHGLLVPLILPICAYAVDFRPLARKIIWIITGIIMFAGVSVGFASVLEVREAAGIIRYAASDMTPVWAEKIDCVLSFGSVLPLIGSGIYLGIKRKNWCLFWSGFLMFAFSALGPATGCFDLIFLISVPGEFFMMLFMLLFCNSALQEDFIECYN